MQYVKKLCGSCQELLKTLSWQSLGLIALAVLVVVCLLYCLIKRRGGSSKAEMLKLKAEADQLKK